MTKHLCRSFALAALVACAAARAGEAPSVTAEAHPRSIGAARLSMFTGVPDLVSASASLTALRPLELEAGVSWLIALSSWYARGGLSLILKDDRDSTGHGWTMHLALLAGYRYMRTITAVPTTSGSPSSEARYVTVNASYEAVYWVRPHLGLELHATLGAMVPFASNTLMAIIPEVPDGRVAAGLAF